MEASSPPPTRQVYYPSLWRRFIFLFASLVPIAIIWASYLYHTWPNFHDEYLQSMCLLTSGITLLISALFSPLTMFVRLELSQTGIIMYGSGYYLYTPWQNIKAIEEVIYGGTRVTGLMLKRSGVTGITIAQGIEKQRPVFHLSLWVLFTPLLRDAGRMAATSTGSHVRHKNVPLPIGDYERVIPVSWFARGKRGAELWSRISDCV